METKPLVYLLDSLFSPCSLEQPVQFTPLQVTTNLESALRYLRKEKQSRTLWTDALCIDQRNEDEKGAQVQLMDRIYAKATATIVWLGGYHGQEEPELCGGKESGDCKHRRQIEAAFSLVGILGGWRYLFYWNLHERVLMSQGGLKDLAKRGWWERLWVIQEVSLSTGRVYIQSEHELCAYECFRTAWRYIFRSCPEMRLIFLPSVNMMETIDKFRYSPTHDKRSPAYANGPSGNLLASIHSFHHLRLPERLHCILLRTSGRFKCRDTRDRLHAVLGIAGGVTVGPRHKMAFFLNRAFLPILEFIAIWICFAPLFSDGREILEFRVVVHKAVPWIWSLYYNSIARYWTISRPEYIIPGCGGVLDALKEEEVDSVGFFTNLAAYLAEETCCLSFLDALSCEEGQEDTMPSWVPDWSKKVSTSENMFKRLREWTRFCITDAGRTLQVEGRCRTILDIKRLESGDTLIAHTDESMTVGKGYMEVGKVEKGDRLLSVPGCCSSMVLRQEKLAYRWRIIGRADALTTEDWVELRKDGKLQVLTIV
ncbi:unnamed protein product [Fusarium graminearum]|uniref:Heterokaryon incompatibility domain-containing protein n=1 Tax=Gibberella zeae TaxID=5518 RepID=A0A9N8NH23_GIBZA|nr:unnamed protein product [Fusarium graminearum]